MLRAANLINGDSFERMGTHGCEGMVNAETAILISEFIRNKLSTMKPGDRVRYDLFVTSAPKELANFGPTASDEPPIDVVELYSATYDWLLSFAGFCNRCGGFKVM